MKSISIQFHATIEELVQFVETASADLGLPVTMMVLQPFSLKSVDGKIDIDELLALLEDSFVEFVLSADEVNENATSTLNFADHNPGRIYVQIGQSTPGSLQQSALMFMSDDEDKIRTANRVASRLKKMTKAGMIAVNPDTGAEAKIRIFRYTDGAKAKYDEGIKLLPVAGKSILKIPD